MTYGKSEISGTQLICAIILFWGIGVMVGANVQRESSRKAAVERGYAEWVTDSSGNSTFRWIEPGSDAPQDPTSIREQPTGG